MIDVWLRDTLTTAWGRAIAMTRLAIPTSSNAVGRCRRHDDRFGIASRISERLA